MTEEVWKSPSIPWDQCDAKRKANLRQVWKAGNLRWKLDPSQQAIYDQIYATHSSVLSAAERMFCMELGRQSGKDFLMSVMAVEYCLRNRRMLRIPYGCPTADTVHELLAPTMFAIFTDCPPELMPKEIANGTFRNSRSELNWEWGAKIALIGCDLHPQWLRGPASEVFMVTEPGFIDGLEEIIDGILVPQQLTIPHGWSVLASTPSDSPGHPWIQKYLVDAQARGMYAKRTIWQCPRFNKEQVAGFIKVGGGEKATKVRREYFCEHVIETTMAVVPEFQEVKEQIVTDVYDIPAYRDTYVAIDPGFSHATGALFAYYDFAKAKVVIEGDFATKGLNSREVSRYVKAREWQLWGRVPVKPVYMTDEAWEDELVFMRKFFYRDLPVPISPAVAWRNNEKNAKTYMRVSDTESRLIADMSVEHGLTISATAKDDSLAALNNFRIHLAEGRYLINPRCTTFISHLEQAIWNKGRTKFADEAGGGHFDTIPAAVYLNRNMVWGKNPNPPAVHNKHTHHVPAGSKPRSKTQQAMESIFGRNRR